MSFAKLALRNLPFRKKKRCEEALNLSLASRWGSRLYGPVTWTSLSPEASGETSLGLIFLPLELAMSRCKTAWMPDRILLVSEPCVYRCPADAVCVLQCIGACIQTSAPLGHKPNKSICRMRACVDEMVASCLQLYYLLSWCLLEARPSRRMACMSSGAAFMEQV